MKILVIGGMHGNEPLGINLVEKIKASKIPNVDAVTANNMALIANKRFTTQDLNRSFPGDITSSEYELNRAAELTLLCNRYDVVLDFHNTYCPGNDCSFIGENANQQLLDVSSFLDLNRIIIADYDCINKYALNCISVEISMNSTLNDVETWYQKIINLSQQALLPKQSSIERYKFVYRMTLEDRDTYTLANQGLVTFEPIRPQLARKMGLDTPAYPIFINDTFTPYNYGALLNKL
ncbi:MAG: succinylglutamate desuccinylase [Candidatus Saccharibacteria bacterium]|nr:succinylglutamate desuccinylase [Candidatus Saccharibacteria bacterium]